MSINVLIPNFITICDHFKCAVQTKFSEKTADQHSTGRPKLFQCPGISY